MSAAPSLLRACRCDGHLLCRECQIAVCGDYSGEDDADEKIIKPFKIP